MNQLSTRIACSRDRLLLALLPLCASSAAAQSLDWSVGGHFGDNSFGRSAAMLGDVDGDGFDDVAIGEPDGSPTSFHDGALRVFSGHDGSELHSLAGGTPLRGFGVDVAPAGDLDGDGRADFAIASFETPPVVFSGSNAALLFSMTSAVGFPTTLLGGHDFDGDGYLDVATGDTSGNGNVRIVSGAYMANGTPPEFLRSFTGPSAGGDFGLALGAADINGDGTPDLIVSAPSVTGTDSYGPFRGIVKVFSGANGGTLREYRQYESAYTGYGMSVAGAGDLDLDGHDEILIGIRFSDEQGTNSGSVRVHDGASDGLVRTHLGLQAGAQFGNCVRAAGDVSGDGYPDYIVGAVGDSTGGPGGTAWLYSGWNGSPFAFLGGNGGAFGEQLAAGGNFDGDAYPDFVVTAPFDLTGRAYAYSANCVGGSFATCPGAANSITSAGASLTSSGSSSLSSGTLTLLARQCPALQSGVFFYGVVEDYFPYGDGAVCTSGGFYRLRPNVQVDAQGIATLPLDFSSAPIGSGPGMIQPGDTRYFQFWYRDPNGPLGSGWNYSAGRAIVFCP